MIKKYYIEWRDAVGKGHYTAKEDDKPKTVLLRGTTWLIGENETDYTVAAYLADDGGFLDIIAIAKSAVETMEEVEEA